MNLIFAYDAPTDSAATDLFTWMQTEPTMPHWALVDVALMGTDRFKSVAHRQQWSPINALANTPLASFGEVAPHLIAISEEPHLRELQTEQLLQLTAGTPALSWLRSTYPERALQMLFGYLAKAHIQDRPKPVHIRFSDTRILPELLQTLSPAQQRRVVDIAGDWCWFDRCGQWQAWFVEHESIRAAEIDSETYLHLSNGQFNQLLNAAEGDEVFHTLAHQCADLVPTQQRGRFHQSITKFLMTADRLHLSKASDRALFVFLSLRYGDGFHRCEVLKSTWQAVRTRRSGLQQMVDTWDEPTLSTLNNYKAQA